MARERFSYKDWVQAHYAENSLVMAHFNPAEHSFSHRSGQLSSASEAERIAALGQIIPDAVLDQKVGQVFKAAVDCIADSEVQGERYQKLEKF